MKRQRPVTKRAREALGACIGPAFLAAGQPTRLPPRGPGGWTGAFPIGWAVFFYTASNRGRPAAVAAVTRGAAGAAPVSIFAQTPARELFPGGRSVC